MVELCPSKIDMLESCLSECDPYLEIGPYRGNQIKMRSLGWACKKKKNLDTDMHTETMPCKVWSYATASQGTTKS